MYKLLNIVCGGRYHKDWINIDFHADSIFVKKVNILAGIPLKDDSVDVVYSSHFLEHLSEQQAIFVLSEAKKLLKENGILRIVVPNLENICREYLKVLEEVETNFSSHEKYDWITIELLDQLVRVNNGGKMASFFKNVSKTKHTKLANYILKRTGDELITETTVNKKRVIAIDKIKNKLLYSYLRFIRLLIPINLRDLIFVNTSIGEKHQWMYDKYSLKKIFENLGFKNINVKKFNESDIPHFNNYLLDIKEDRTVYKGSSSIYMEAVK